MDINKQKTLDEYVSLLNAGGDAYTRLALLFDEGTFVESGRFVKRGTTEFDENEGNEFEGVVTGYGAVDGRLVFAFAQEPSRMKGAMSEAQAGKIIKTYEAAVKSGAPLVGIFDSAGAKILEGTTALSAYGSIMKASAAASGMIPQIAVISGICSGSNAAIAAMADIIIGAADKGEYYIGSPFILNAKKDKPVNGSINAASKNGTVNVTAAGSNGAITKARSILSLLPSNNAEGIAYTQTEDSVYRETVIGSIKDTIKSIADNGSVIELTEEYAPESVTALGTISGMTVGFVATDHQINSGVITSHGANKAAKFISFCDSFNIPVVTLVDSEGVTVSEKEENTPLAAALARLACAYASSSAPKVTAVIGKAYGSSFTLLGSKSLGADVEFACENAIISIMSPDAAVEFIYGDKIKASADPASEKAKAEAEWNGKFSSSVAAARCGAIDDIIKTSELRARIASALEMLSSKAISAPVKKHGNLPL